MSVQDKEKMAVRDMRRLQKRFQIAAEKTKSYGANVMKKMEAQEKEIQALTEERKGLSVKLSLLQSPRNMALDERNCMELQDLLQTKDQYDSLIRDRKAQLSELDKQIEELQKKAAKENRIAGKVKQANSSKQLQKQIETLELRLYNITVHFDTILARRKELQEEIENLRTQKAVLDRVYLKLPEKLYQQRRRLDTHVKQSALAYNQWKKTLQKISDMNEMRKKEWYYIEQQKKHNRIAEKMTKLKNFMESKHTDRSPLTAKAKKRKALKAAKKAKQKHWESLERQELAYKRLLQLAEDGDVDGLLNGFLEMEQKKVVSFHYTFEPNVGLEELQKRTKQLEMHILLTRTWEQERRSNLHVLQELEKNLMKITEEANRYEEGCKKSSKYLDVLKSRMKDLLQIIDCDSTTIMKHLEEDRQMTEQMALQLFGAVENKTKKLLLLESRLTRPPADGSQQGHHPCRPLLPRAMGRPQLRLPPRDMDDNETVLTTEMPLDHDQLRQLILRSQEME